MARQSIPRFDLYAALGVEPSADTADVEAAYDELIAGHGAGSGAAVERRIFRARVAREWLTDPELRGRYDASRERAASRAAAKAAGIAAEADATEDAADDLPWLTADDLPELERPSERAPAADVERPDPTIAWSSTPPAPPERRRRRSTGRPAGALGLAALLIAAAIVGYVGFQAFGSNEIASRATDSPPPVQTAAPTEPPATLGPTVAPTVETTAPPPSPTAPGIDTAALQQASWEALQAIITAASAGDVATAQTYFGDSAPDLRASGLRRATFPEMTSDQMTVTGDDTGYGATLTDGTTMRSTDGITWTLDYGDRPLAAFRPPNAPVDHDLWWQSGGAKHHIFLRVTLATFSSENLWVTAKWSFDPSLPDDATYFANAQIRISAVTFDGGAIDSSGDVSAIGGVTTATTHASLPDTTSIPDEMEVTISVTPDGNPDRSVETTFALEVR